jgi:tetratricopeptide (TPR) repeat protein
MCLILSVLFALPGLRVADADSACQRASYLLCHRHLNQAWFDSARTLVAGVRQREPANETGLCLWTRVLLQLGDDAPDVAEKKAWYARARAVADTLRRRGPGNPNGHMWWATAQGKLGQCNGILSSVGMIGDLKREFGQALELDSDFALAWYALGRLYAALPSVLGGNLNLAEDRLRRGLSVDSNYTIIRLELARVYLRQRRHGEARRELRSLLATGQPTDPAEFTLSDQPAAIELLDSIEAAHKQSPGS